MQSCWGVYVFSSFYRQLFQDDHIVGVMLFNFCQMLRIENILCGKKIDVEKIADFLHDFCILQSVNLYPVDGIRPMKGENSLMEAP